MFGSHGPVGPCCIAQQLNHWVDPRDEIALVKGPSLAYKRAPFPGARPSRDKN